MGAATKKLRRVLCGANRAKNLQGRLAALAKVRPAYLAPAIPQNSEPRTGLSVGESAALTALEWNIGREEQDELAVASHRNLAAEDGVGVLLISTELEEIIDLSDRILVISKGRIVGEMTRATLDMERLGLLMGGAGLDIHDDQDI